MPPSDDSTQAISDAGSGSTSCSVTLTSATTGDCTGAVIQTNSVVEEKTVMGALESEPEVKEVNEIIEDNAEEESTSLTRTVSGEEKEASIVENSVEIQENEKTEETVVPNEEETTPTEAKESSKDEANASGEQNDLLQDSESKDAQTSNSEDDIEWLTPFSLPKTKSGEEDDNTAAEADDASSSTKGRDNPLKVLKKGAVAAVGGSMVGLGLVMIPLPTPFGAVVASSGLAVLGTEFDEAKDLNDRLIGSAKGHLNKARDSIVQGIEKMNKDDLDDDDVDIPEISNSQSNESSVETEGGNVIKMNAKTLNKAESNVSEVSENSEDGSASEPPPVWLHMNPIERQRQERLAKQKYRRDKQTSYEQAKDAMKKRTGKFLSKTILPFIKKAEPTEEAKPQEVSKNNEEPTKDESMTEEPTAMSKSDGESEAKVHDTAKGGDLPAAEKEVGIKLETKDDETSCTIVSNENDSDGYVVVS